MLAPGGRGDHGLRPGLLRDHLGNYDSAWYLGGALCLLAAGLSMGLRGPARPIPLERAPS